MTNDLSWESLLGIEPRLKEVLDTAKELKSVRNRKAHFCANSYWLVSLPGKLSFKRVLEKLFGENTEAFVAASRKIYFNLPDCKNCFCKTAGLVPKKKRLIQIEKLLWELKKGADWYNSNPDDREEFKALYLEAQAIFNELEVLGVPRTFSESVLIFGPESTTQLVLQFEEDEK